MSDLARYIQEKQEEYTDVEHTSLMAVLSRYRSSLPPAEVAKHKLPKAHRDAIQEIEEGLDEIMEYTRLYRRQTARLDIDGETEKKIGKLFPTMTQEIRVAGALRPGAPRFRGRYR